MCLYLQKSYCNCIIIKHHKIYSFIPNVAQYIWNLYVQYILLYVTLNIVLMKNFIASLFM